MAVRTLLACLALTAASQAADLQMIVTVADHASHKPAELKINEVNIFDATITDWRKLAAGDLELFLVIDDAANYDFGSKLQQLRTFVTSQPAAVSIGVAYIHDGVLQMASQPTTDHAAVVSALRAPSGSKTGNPWCALSDLMEQWPKKSVRREVVLVSPGVDDSAVEGAICANAETAIRDAERGGVQIFALFNPAQAYLTESWKKTDSGVSELAHVCFESGGEAYFRGNEASDTVAPYLADIAEHLANQYLVSFRVTDAAPRGAFRKLFVMSGATNPELMVPDSVWIPANGKR